MSKPRPKHPGRSYRITMRCVFRKFLLKPCREINQTLGYWLGVISKRHGVLVHSFAAMSDHLHLDVTDPYGKLDAFRRDFKGTFTRAANAFWGRWEYLWAPNDGITEVTTARDAALGMAYTICNPVEAGLTSTPDAWPGLCTTSAELGATQADCRQMTFGRPAHFFRTSAQGGRLPDTVTWSLAPHPLAGDDAERFVESVRKQVRRRIERKRRALKRAGERFAGAAAVMRRKWWQAPRTAAPRRKRNPRIAAKNPAVRLAMIARLQRFRQEYAEARATWLDTGQAEFPAGTNLLRAYPGVTVRAGPKRYASTPA